MCGIFGIYTRGKGGEINESRFNESLKIISHRGPDNINSYFHGSNALGHTRLSIIDLNKKSNQPFHSFDGRYSLIFNGEIYNYIEIRKELEDEGVVFKTEGDTEVLLEAFISWGDLCVKKFNGMWAFLVYDSAKNRFFCSRDRFGIKPLYYCEYNNQILVASEIKTILKYYPELAEPNYNVIANYCRTSIGAQHTETWFENIHRIEPATNVVFTEGEMKVDRYWEYPKVVDKKITFDQALEQYRKLFLDSVRIRMRSDVPIGITLSSGIDSSSIACVMDKIDDGVNFRTYTAKFEDSNYSQGEKQNYKKDIEINEAKVVERLTSSLGMSSELVEINYEGYVSNLKKLIWHLESGHGSPAIYPLDQVVEEAKNDVKVLLEGQGADELLAGYINVAGMAYIVDQIKRFNLLKAYKEWRCLTETYSYKIAVILFMRQLNINFVNRTFLCLSGIEKLFIGPIKQYKPLKDYPRNPVGFDDTLNKHLYEAHTGGLVNLLHYGDAISMKHSLESRLPFMDYRLVELAFKLPPEFKIHNGQGKYIHRKAMEGILPDFILKNKIKFGFDSPLNEILFKDGKHSVKSILFSDKCLERKLFDEEALRNMFLKPQSSLINTTRYIYRILCVELWFRVFIDKEEDNSE